MNDGEGKRSGVKVADWWRLALGLAINGLVAHYHLFSAGEPQAWRIDAHQSQITPVIVSEVGAKPVAIARVMRGKSKPKLAQAKSRQSRSRHRSGAGGVSFSLALNGTVKPDQLRQEGDQDLPT